MRARKENEMSNYFEELNRIDVSDKTENKGKKGLTYLSWAWAWGELKKRHPDATSTVYENENGWNYFTDGRYAWVKTGVTVNGIEHIEYLPVMDYKNDPITADRITSFDVNKTIQRSITKAIARHGLGLYIYAGEDLPDEADGAAEDRKRVSAKQTKELVEEEKQAAEEMEHQISAKEAKDLKAFIETKGADEKVICDFYKVADVSALTKAQYGQIVRRLMSK